MSAEGSCTEGGLRQGFQLKVYNERAVAAGRSNFSESTEPTDWDDGVRSALVEVFRDAINSELSADYLLGLTDEPRKLEREPRGEESGDGELVVREAGVRTPVDTEEILSLFRNAYQVHRENGVLPAACHERAMDLVRAVLGGES